MASNVHSDFVILNSQYQSKQTLIVISFGMNYNRKILIKLYIHIMKDTHLIYAISIKY